MSQPMTATDATKDPSGSSEPRTIKIFDTTLRDGEQSPGASMNLAEKLEVAQLLAEMGVDVIQNRCPKIEYQRLFGELRMGGFATGIISSKLG